MPSRIWIQLKLLEDAAKLKKCVLFYRTLPDTQYLRDSIVLHML